MAEPAVGAGRAGLRPSPPRALAGRLHQLPEPRVVHGQPVLREGLGGHLVWEPVGVVEPERVLRRDPGRGLGARVRHDLREQALSLFERAAEALLLRGRPAGDRRPLAPELRIGLAHDRRDALAERHQERPVDSEHAALADRPAHDAPEYVAAVLVRRDDAVRHQERHRAAVVGEDPQRRALSRRPGRTRDRTAPRRARRAAGSCRSRRPTGRPGRAPPAGRARGRCRCCASGARRGSPPAPSSYCMKTRFQNSRNRSVSSPGRSSSAP